MTDANQKILIVEDETPLREALRDKLLIERFTVFEAKNGEAGLEIALREHPDLILLDVVMPVMDGLTMLEKLRADAWGRGAKVILLTNASDNVSISKAIEQGSYDYLLKSDWKIQDVVTKIRERLR